MGGDLHGWTNDLENEKTGMWLISLDCPHLLICISPPSRTRVHHLHGKNVPGLQTSYCLFSSYKIYVYVLLIAFSQLYISNYHNYPFTD